jgi:hypothetical protein
MYNGFLDWCKMHNVNYKLDLLGTILKISNKMFLLLKKLNIQTFNCISKLGWLQYDFQISIPDEMIEKWFDIKMGQRR